ncbi:hypothetical protein GCM10027440_48700 [Nocardiopsis coralliicola]
MTYAGSLAVVAIDLVVFPVPPAHASGRVALHSENGGRPDALGLTAVRQEGRMHSTLRRDRSGEPAAITGRARVTRWLTGTKFKGTEARLPGQNGAVALGTSA